MSPKQTNRLVLIRDNRARPLPYLSAERFLGANPTLMWTLR